jgi:hypothetical protein
VPTDLERVSHQYQPDRAGRPQVKPQAAAFQNGCCSHHTVRSVLTSAGKGQRRLHLLDGLLIAFLNWTRSFASFARRGKPVLMARFALSESGQYILETKLRQLAPGK